MLGWLALTKRCYPPLSLGLSHSVFGVEGKNVSWIAILPFRAEATAANQSTPVRDSMVEIQIRKISIRLLYRFREPVLFPSVYLLRFEHWPAPAVQHWSWVPFTGLPLLWCFTMVLSTQKEALSLQLGVVIIVSESTDFGTPFISGPSTWHCCLEQYK